jgi:hypothetical protein
VTAPYVFHLRCGCCVFPPSGALVEAADRMYAVDDPNDAPVETAGCPVHGGSEVVAIGRLGLGGYMCPADWESTRS